MINRIDKPLANITEKGGRRRRGHIFKLRNQKGKIITNTDGTERSHKSTLRNKSIWITGWNSWFFKGNVNYQNWSQSREKPKQADTNADVSNEYLSKLYQTLAFAQVNSFKPSRKGSLILFKVFQRTEKNCLNNVYKVTATPISKPDPVQKKKLSRNLTCIKAISINILAENIHQNFWKLTLKKKQDDSILKL